MNAFIVNCRPHNWEACYQNTIFGLKKGISLPSLKEGDLILFRINGSNYGVKALWYFEKTERVIDQNKVPWTDSDYDWLLRCKNIVTLSKPFSEDFQTSSKKSSKITSLYAGGIIRSIVSLKKLQFRDYLINITQEFKNELDIDFVYVNEKKNALKFLHEIIDQIEIKKSKINDFVIDSLDQTVETHEDLEEEIKYPKDKLKTPLYGIVGERVDLPILNYAPLNEKGVILLFGYYLQDLGISHVEEIKSGFPDAIAMRSIGNGKYQRVRIEFEFKSSSFLKHGHSIEECDLIVCWKHDWIDCPIEVVELSSVLFEKDNNF